MVLILVIPKQNINSTVCFQMLTYRGEKNGDKQNGLVIHIHPLLSYYIAFVHDPLSFLTVNFNGTDITLQRIVVTIPLNTDFVRNMNINILM